MDGEITIGTKLDTDKFDRQISQLEKKMKKDSMQCPDTVLATDRRKRRL